MLIKEASCAREQKRDYGTKNVTSTTQRREKRRRRKRELERRKKYMLVMRLLKFQIVVCDLAVREVCEFKGFVAKGLFTTTYIDMYFENRHT